MDGSSNTIKSPNEGSQGGESEYHEHSSPLSDLNGELSKLLLRS